MQIHLYNSSCNVRSYVILFHISFLESSGIFFHHYPRPSEKLVYIPCLSYVVYSLILPSSNWNILYRRCFFRSNSLINLDGIAFCYFYQFSLSSIVNIHYCILLWWRANELRGSDEPWKSEKLQEGTVEGWKRKRKGAPVIPRYQQYCYPQNRVNNYILIL